MSIAEGKVQKSPLMRGLEFQFSNPLISGLSFALSNKRALFAFAALPLILELLIAEDQYRNALPDRVIYFVHIPVIVLANAWQLAAVTMYVIQLAQGQTQSLVGIGASALQNLPKILISYVLLIFVTGLGVALAPLMCFVVFFIWAPLFCVGELFVPYNAGLRDEEVEAGGWDDDPTEPQPQRTFTRRGVFELGFGRSIGLASRNLAPTLQVAALFWFVSTVPGALVALVYGPKISLACQLLQILFTNLATMLAIGIVASVFIDLLGKEARLELALPLEDEPPAHGLGHYRRPLRFDRMFIATMVLVSIAALATWFELRNNELQRVMPPDASIQASGAVVEGNRIAVTVNLSDPVSELRWLYPTQFVLSVGGPADEKDWRSGMGLELMRELGAQDRDQGKKDSLPAKQLTSLSRAYPFDAEGKPVENSNFAPYPKPLKLVLYFKIPDIAIPGKSLVGDTAAAGAITALNSGSAGSLPAETTAANVREPGSAVGVRPAAPAENTAANLAANAAPASYPVNVYLYYSTYEGLGKPIFHGSVNLQAP